MIYFTSDTHFGHKNVIKYCGRPYANLDEMEESLIINWNRNVDPDDTVYHLGDFAFCRPYVAKDIVYRLNGHIKLIPGNHDSRQFLNVLYEIPQSKIEVLERYVELNYENRKFVLCHYPIESWNGMSNGSIHLHGHSHGNSRAQECRFDVGVDAKETGYAPVQIETIRLWANNQHPAARPDRRGEPDE
jgi:calcineurin-like phosphoesterase family protein